MNIIASVVVGAVIVIVVFLGTMYYTSAVDFSPDLAAESDSAAVEPDGLTRDPSTGDQLSLAKSKLTPLMHAYQQAIEVELPEDIVSLEQNIMNRAILIDLNHAETKEMSFLHSQLESACQEFLIAKRKLSELKPTYGLMTDLHGKIERYQDRIATVDESVAESVNQEVDTLLINAPGTSYSTIDTHSITTSQIQNAKDEYLTLAKNIRLEELKAQEAEQERIRDIQDQKEKEMAIAQEKERQRKLEEARLEKLRLEREQEIRRQAGQHVLVLPFVNRTESVNKMKVNERVVDIYSVGTKNYVDHVVSKLDGCVNSIKALPPDNRYSDPVVAINLGAEHNVNYVVTGVIHHLDVERAGQQFKVSAEYKLYILSVDLKRKVKEKTFTSSVIVPYYEIDGGLDRCNHETASKLIDHLFAPVKKDVDFLKELTVSQNIDDETP